MGIDAHKFNKVVSFQQVAYNNRDQCKILAADGQIGYMGGVNLADEYIKPHWAVWSLEGQCHPFRWDELQGLKRDLPHEPVRTLTVGKSRILDRYHMDNRVEGEGLYILMGVGQSRFYKSQVGKTVYQNMINQATDYVYITTLLLWIIDYDLFAEDIRNAYSSGWMFASWLVHIPDTKIDSNCYAWALLGSDGCRSKDLWV